MAQVALKTHLIVTDIHDEYKIDWFGKLKDVKPLLCKGAPVFVIVSSLGRTEINTFDIGEIERTAKILTNPRGRESITTDSARIYIKEDNGNEKLLGKVIQNHIKKYAPMYDKVEYI